MEKHNTLHAPWSIVDGKAYNGTPEPKLINAKGKEIFLFAWFTPSDRPALDAIVEAVNGYAALADTSDYDTWNNAQDAAEEQRLNQLEAERDQAGDAS